MSVMPPNLSIKQWEPDDRPREKLKEKGAESLSLAELLAIIIGSGSPGESAVELMKRILYSPKKWTLGPGTYFIAKTYKIQRSGDGKGHKN